MTGDKIDDAIGATADPFGGLTMAEIGVNIASTGRPAMLLVPSDLTVDELRELAGWMLLHLRSHIDARKRPAIEIVRGSLPPAPRT